MLNSKKDLAAASLYFYLGYYSGMRDSLNQLRSLNPIPREEPEEMRQLIEELPTEVATLRYGADPEPAIMKIRLLMQDELSTLDSRETRTLSEAVQWIMTPIY